MKGENATPSTNADDLDHWLGRMRSRQDHLNNNRKLYDNIDAHLEGVDSAHRANQLRVKAKLWAEKRGAIQWTLTLFLTIVMFTIIYKDVEKTDGISKIASHVQRLQETEASLATGRAVPSAPTDGVGRGKQDPLSVDAVLPDLMDPNSKEYRVGLAVLDAKNRTLRDAYVDVWKGEQREKAKKYYESTNFSNSADQGEREKIDPQSVLVASRNRAHPYPILRGNKRVPSADGLVYWRTYGGNTREAMWDAMQGRVADTYTSTDILHANPALMTLPSGKLLCAWFSHADHVAEVTSGEPRNDTTEATQAAIEKLIASNEIANSSSSTV
ncbi:hypothetical protein CYMTET_33425, partial [Cymbomonas tetramitiformis]